MITYSIIQRRYVVQEGKLVIEHPMMPSSSHHQVDLALDAAGQPGACPAGIVTQKHRPRGFGSQERTLFDEASPPAPSSYNLEGSPTLEWRISTAALVIQWTASPPPNGAQIWVTAVGRS